MTRPAAFLASALALAAPAAPAFAWDYFEHRYLVDVACAEWEKAKDGAGEQAREKARRLCIPVEGAGRPELRVTLGDLAAMAGDHFGKPADLLKALRDYRKAVDGLGKPAPESPTPPESTDLGRVLQAREFQLAGVQAWLLASPARIEAARKHRLAWLVPDGLQQPPVAPLDAAQEQLLQSELSRAEQRVPAAEVRRVSPTALERLRKSARQTREFLEGEHPDRAPLLGAAGELPAWSAVDATYLPPLRGDCYAAGPDEEALFAQLDGYVTLAARNGAHFGADTVAAAERFAQEARQLRADAGGWCEEDCAARLAFALHHWSDRFSAGHMRTPRNRLANMEAKRRHDFDDVNGLVVFQVDDPKQSLWRAFGDSCLLGATAATARERTIEGTRRLLRIVVEAPSQATYPELAPQNPPVPRSPRYVDVRVEPGFGGAWAAGRSHRASFAARWELDIHLRSRWTPPPLSQAILTGPRLDAFVPVAVEPLELALQLIDGIRQCDEDATPPQKEACWRRATTSWAAYKDLSLQPAVGWALARSNGGPLHSSAYAALFARYELYDGLFAGVSFEAFSGRPWAFAWSLNAALRIR